MKFKQGEMPIRRKANNQSMILQTIYHFGPIKRPDIADLLDLTRPTITTAVKVMIEKGIVREITDFAEPEDTVAMPGRKAYPVAIEPTSRYFIGVEMRISHRTLCITDFLGEVVYRQISRETIRQYEKNVESVSLMIRQALAEGGIPEEQIAGIGIAVPGLVDGEQGILRIHPGYGWENKPIVKDIIAAVGCNCPVSLDNNACARTRSVQLFHKEPVQGQSFAYLFISSGIACPLMLNGFGSYGSVVGIGEVGHTVMDPNGPLCRCGNHGCLEAFSSDMAILARCREAMEAGKAACLRKLCGGKEITMELVRKAQDQGDPDVEEIIRKALNILGLSVSNICNFACPGTMFIEGLLFERQENRDQLQEVIRSNLYSANHACTEIVFLQPDPYSGAIGAAAVAVKEDLENYQEKKKI